MNFTLMVAKSTNMQTILVVEISMMPHFAGDKRVGLRRHCITKHESSGAAANGHTSYWLASTRCMKQPFCFESPFHQTQEILRFHRIRQLADNTASATTIGQRTQEFHVFETEQLGCSKIHTAMRIVQICVRSIDGNIIFYRLCHDALDIILVSNAFQPVKQQWMMRHHKVIALMDGLREDIFRDVQTQ